jgi:hypothetical protein
LDIGIEHSLSTISVGYGASLWNGKSSKKIDKDKCSYEQADNEQKSWSMQKSSSENDEVP